MAAATTSLPEKLGGVRNWDYRFCWLRDATFTLYAMLENGYRKEAVAWRDWLVRAVAGAPAQMQIMYSIDGGRRLTELALDWLPGYEGSKPVRIGNAAAQQFQLDVFGEVMDVLHQARRQGMEADPVAWHVQRTLLDFLESRWNEPDEGLWEVRGPRRQFTHSKLMAWVAFDRAVKAVEALSPGVLPRRSGEHGLEPRPHLGEPCHPPAGSRRGDLETCPRSIHSNCVYSNVRLVH